MSAHLHYSVHATFADSALRAAFEDWLVNGHLADVLRNGDVLSAEVLRFDGTPIRSECRYVFSSREAFLRYETGPAEKLRAEGRAKFPFGVEFSRSTGLLVQRLTASDLQT